MSDLAAILSDMRSLDPYDESLRLTLDTIDRCGWALQMVGTGTCSCCESAGVEPDPPSGPPFCYTIGLTERELPELLMVGLVAGELLNGLAARLVSHGLPCARYTDTPWGGLDVCVLPATEQATVDDFVRLPQQIWPFSSLSVLQVIWPDSRNRMPWEPRCAIPAGQQPLLSTFDPAKLAVLPWPD